MLKSLLFIGGLASLVWPDAACSQSSEDQIREENYLEAVLTSSDDVPEMLREIEFAEATVDDLRSIPEVNPEFAASIIKYRKKKSSVGSAEELSGLKGATQAALSAIARRFKFPGKRNIEAEAVSFTGFSPQTASLYSEAYGERGVRNFQRLEFKYGNYELSVVTDKDPGERSYADFYSISAAAKPFSIFSSVNLGDYRISMGNGMMFSSGGMVSKSAEAITPLFNRSPYSLKPYKSRGETRYLRGAAFEIPAGEFGFTGFVSRKSFDAHLDTAGRVTTIDYSGLNPGNMENPSGNKLGETLMGGIVSRVTDWGTLGIAGVYLSYDRPFSDYYLSNQAVWDFFMRGRAGRLAVSCEATADWAVSFSANVGIDYDDARFAVGIRNLRSRIVSNYGGALSESFPVSPEEGIYFGTWLRPAEAVRLGFYYDRFRIISPVGDPERNGEEIFGECYVTMARPGSTSGSGTMLYLRYKYKNREDYYIPESEFPAALSSFAGYKQTFRVEWRQSLSRVVSFRARLEKNFLSTGESGELFAFDFTVRESWLSVSQKASFFHTGSFSSAFYMAESDLPGVATYALLYGDGARVSVSANWKVNGALTIGAKVSRDIYDRDREVSVESSTRILSGITTLSVELACVVR